MEQLHHSPCPRCRRCGRPIYYHRPPFRPHAGPGSGHGRYLPGPPMGAPGLQAGGGRLTGRAAGRGGRLHPPARTSRGSGAARIGCRSRHAHLSSKPGC